MKLDFILVEGAETPGFNFLGKKNLGGGVGRERRANLGFFALGWEVVKEGSDIK